MNVPMTLCGGVGFRLWPLSRENCPKHYVRLPNNTTLIGQTHERAATIPGVLEGTAKVVNGVEKIQPEINQSTFNAMGVKHRLENPSALPLMVFEVQTGDYLGEDDIVRFGDKYGRS